MNYFEYAAPATLGEAFALLGTFGTDAKILNGGTDVVLQLREKLIAPKLVIDIKHIPGLRDLTFDEEEGLTIGSCVTMNELGESAAVKTHYPALSQAALSVGSKQVRSRATCAGNIVNASPLADTATPLLAYDAVVVAHSSEGVREIPMEAFFLGVRKTSLRAGEIVTAIRVPYPSNSKGEFSKISRRHEVDLSTICATVLQTERGYRIAFGAVAPTPIRLKKTETLLGGSPLNEALIADAVKLAAGEVSPIDDVRATKEYRLEVVGVVLARSLETLLRGEREP